VEVEAAARLRGVITRLSRQLNSSAAVEGLTPAQASALALVVSRGRLSLAELTAIEGLNPTMVSRVVRTLVRQGLISRTPDPRDLRVFVVEATPAGRRMQMRIRDKRDRVVADALARLGQEQQEAIMAAVSALEELVGTLGGASPR